MLSKLTWQIVALVLGLTLIAVVTIFGTLGWLIAAGKAAPALLAVPLGALVTGLVSSIVYYVGQKSGHAIGKNEAPDWLPDGSTVTVTAAPPAGGPPSIAVVLAAPVTEPVIVPTMRPPPAPSPEPGLPTTLVATPYRTETSWVGMPPEDDHGNA